MRIVLILLTISATGFAQSDTLSARGRMSDGWWQKDKLKHLTTSFYLTMSSYYFQNRCADIAAVKAERNAVLFTVSCGVSKEIWDSRRPEGFFSWRDLICDIMGTAAALVFIRVAT